MIANDDKRPEYSSDLADVRSVPLADVSVLSGSPLRRVLPESLNAQVPVAAFNSAI